MDEIVNNHNYFWDHEYDIINRNNEGKEVLDNPQICSQEIKKDFPYLINHNIIKNVKNTINPQYPIEINFVSIRSNSSSFVLTFVIVDKSQKIEQSEEIILYSEENSIKKKQSITIPHIEHISIRFNEVIDGICVNMCEALFQPMFSKENLSFCNGALLSVTCKNVFSTPSLFNIFSFPSETGDIYIICDCYFPENTNEKNIVTISFMEKVSNGSIMFHKTNEFQNNTHLWSKNGKVIKKLSKSKTHIDSIRVTAHRIKNISKKNKIQIDTKEEKVFQNHQINTHDLEFISKKTGMRITLSFFQPKSFISSTLEEMIISNETSDQTIISHPYVFHKFFLEKNILSVIRETTRNDIKIALVAYCMVSNFKSWAGQLKQVFLEFQNDLLLSTLIKQILSYFNEFVPDDICRNVIEFIGKTTNRIDFPEVFHKSSFKSIITFDQKINRQLGNKNVLIDLLNKTEGDTEKKKLLHLIIELGINNPFLLCIDQSEDYFLGMFEYCTKKWIEMDQKCLLFIIILISSSCHNIKKVIQNVIPSTKESLQETINNATIQITKYNLPQSFIDIYLLKVFYLELTPLVIFQAFFVKSTISLLSDLFKQTRIDFSNNYLSFDTLILILTLIMIGFSNDFSPQLYEYLSNLFRSVNNSGLFRSLIGKSLFLSLCYVEISSLKNLFVDLSLFMINEQSQKTNHLIGLTESALFCISVINQIQKINKNSLRDFLFSLPHHFLPEAILYCYHVAQYSENIKKCRDLIYAIIIVSENSDDNSPESEIFMMALGYDRKKQFESCIKYKVEYVQFLCSFLDRNENHQLFRLIGQYSRDIQVLYSIINGSKELLFSLFQQPPEHYLISIPSNSNRIDELKDFFEPKFKPSLQSQFLRLREKHPNELNTIHGLCNFTVDNAMNIIEKSKGSNNNTLRKNSLLMICRFLDGIEPIIT